MLVLSACGPVPVYFAGNSDNRSFTFNGRGQLDLVTHAGPFTLSADEVDITCEGRFERVKAGDPFGVGEEYNGGGTCSDGRKATLGIRVHAIGEGEGTANDDCGNSYRVFFNVNEQPIVERTKELKAAAKAAGAPADRCASAAPGAPPHRDPLS